MHKVFGVKEDKPYYDREGAYLILLDEDKIGVVRTSKGLFFVGGGMEEGENKIQCIERECLEEIGYKVSIGEEICSAETYCFIAKIGLFHPIQTYYVGSVLEKVAEPIEKDHRFLWLSYDKLKGNLFPEMQNWALEQLFLRKKLVLTEKK